jgi:hypothetical protein
VGVLQTSVPSFLFHLVAAVALLDFLSLGPSLFLVVVLYAKFHVKLATPIVL